MLTNILNMIHNKDYQGARAELIRLNPVDLAAQFDDLNPYEQIKIFRMLPKNEAAEVFSYFTRDTQINIIAMITDKELGEIIDELFLDDAVDLFEEMPANVVKRLLKNTDDQTRSLINQFLKYPEDSAGSIMTIEYVDLRRNMTVQQALDHIKETGIEKATVYTSYVIDEARKLIGTVSALDLLITDRSETIDKIIESNVPHVKTNADQEEAARLFDYYDLIALPVTDMEDRLVGIITVDDIVDVIQEENTEDFEKMAALLPSDKPYLETGSLFLARKRIPWLLFLMFSAMFTGGIISYFEDSLAVMPALVAFIPMLMDTGGNCGSQAATLVIRGLALGQVKMRDAIKVLLKEFQISIIVGAVLSVINIIRIYFMNSSLILAITVGLSLYVTVIIAKVTGSMLPIIAERFKLDPAIMASPVITTIVDASALLAFFSIARLLLKI
ncbi:MAG: magnesium transporter [Clostridiaceae bacterium]|nr:magnesium transporter [Clostridiaceae bacterium]